MKHQVHLGTESCLVSKEAEQIRMLVSDLARTIQALDAEQQSRPRQGIDLAARRYNLATTVAFLVDRLGSLEKIGSREHSASRPRRPPRLAGSSI